jgi:hypothetical protein
MHVRMVMLGLCASACAATAPDPEFVAQDSDFQDFATWQNWHMVGTAQGNFHTTGPRIVYLNRMPPAGAMAFPVGTILVKTLEDGSGDTFAMVKRGGDYNADWARGWEWMEISKKTGTWQIEWRGNTPPDGASYTEDGVSCNLCHAAARSNDWVQSKALRLPLQ